jgi:4-hydroxymandelate oxidase
MDLLERLEAGARGRLTAAVYDYFAGGAADEETLRANVDAWGSVRLPLRTPAPAGPVDTACDLLGTRVAVPILLGPVAAQGLVHPDGERAAARAAARAGTVFCHPTRATVGLEELARESQGPLWFALYVHPDRAVTEQLLTRVAAAGYAAVILTVDLPVAGRRERELRHGPVPLPPGVTMADHAGATGASETKPAVGGWDPSLTWKDAEWVAGVSGLPVAVKGVLTAADAELAVAHGAAAVVVSNHGGRQLDGCVPTARALPEIVAAVAGRVPVLVDGGIRSGVDVLRALASGASAVLIGRPYVWGLACRGEAGVTQVIDDLASGLSEAMAACGWSAMDEVGPRAGR